MQHWSTAPKRPKQMLVGEAASRVRGWREATGFCLEKLAVLAQAQGLEVSASTIYRYLQRGAWSVPAPRDGGPVFRTAQSCDPVTVRGWVISRWM